MESTSQVNVPLRSGGKKMRKRRELDALVAHSLAKRANKKNNAGNGVNSQDQLLSPSTDEQEDFAWPKIVRGSNRTRNRKFSLIRTCAPLIFVTCISLSLGFMYWLYFDLRQQLYEYRQKIEEVSVTSQNLPDALQKWHETSKNLEQNQTILHGKIIELQHNLKNLSTDFIYYKEKQKDYANDEKIVAIFGAKIASVTADVDSIRYKFSEIQKDQISVKQDLLQVKDNLSEAVSNMSLLFSISSKNYSTEIKNVKESVLGKVESFSSELSALNKSLNEIIQNFDRDSQSHNKSLEVLNNSFVNISSYMSSLNTNWTDQINKNPNDESYKNEFNKEILDIKTVIKEMQSECKNYQMVAKNVDENKKLNNESRKNEEPKLVIPDNEIRITAVQLTNENPTAEVETNRTESTGSNATTESSAEGKPKFLSIQHVKTLN